MALPPAAVFEAALEDVSRADAPAETIARTRIPSPGNPPIAFSIAYDPARILADHQYVIRARILLDERLLFTSDTATPVITRGSPTTVSIVLRRVGAGPTSPPEPADDTSLEGTYWRAIEIAGKPTPQQDPKREAHLVFQAGGRLSGSDGCNWITGSYQRKGDGVTFSQLVGTQMACLNTAGIDGEFREALKRSARLTITGNRLELFDATGQRLAVFAAGAQASVPADVSGAGRHVVVAGQVPGQR
jgi:putative lipoprotein